MHVNFPIYDALKDCHDCQDILIAGAGGGFDVYAGLPLYHELREAGKNVHLFNYSFTNLDAADSALKVHEPNNCLFGFKGNVRVCPERKDKRYFPEGYLAQFLDFKNPNEMVWAVPKLGVVPVRKALNRLVERLSLDAIILVDGGVDSLMQGDEAECGTILEDTVSLAALMGVDVKYKSLMTVGFGTELEDNLSHYFVLKNMADLIRLGGLQGSCCLLKEQPAFQFMKEAYEYTTRQENHAHSHITPRIIFAVHGDFEQAPMMKVTTLDGFETYRSPWFIQPLMNLCWFWSPDTVAKQNKLIDKTFCQTNTFTDVTMVYRQKINGMARRSRGVQHAVLM